MDLDRAGSRRTPRPGLHRPQRVGPPGGGSPTRADVRAGRWVRSSRGLYVPKEIDRGRPEQRILEAAALLPDCPSAAVTGWAALRWLGVAWLDGRRRDGSPLDIALVTPVRDIRPRAGVTPSGERSAPAEVVVVDSVPVTVARRSVCFEMRYAGDLRDAVAVGDAALAAGVCTLGDIAAYVADHPGWTAIPQAREVLPLLVTNSWSPGETEMRLIWELDAGLPRPLCNVPVFDRHERHLGTPDLLDPVAGLIGEYDGPHHLEARQRRRDIRREQDLRTAGLELVTMVAGDSGRRRAMADRILAARARARFEPPAVRAWTLDQPAWWKRAARDRRTSA